MPQSVNEDFAQLRDRLTVALRQVCPFWMRDSIDDLAQNAVMRLMRSANRDEGKGALTAFYLRRVAYSVVVDEMRRLNRRPEIALEDDALDSVGRSAHPNPERLCINEELGLSIQRCLARLLESRRRAVTLVLQGDSVPEAAGRLGWTTKKTENLVYRGLNDLRVCLAKKGLKP